jgi:hypothetical protein
VREHHELGESDRSKNGIFLSQESTSAAASTKFQRNNKKATSAPEASRGVVLLYDDEAIEAMMAALEHSRAEWFHNGAQVFLVMAVFVFGRACLDDFVSIL